MHKSTIHSQIQNLISLLMVAVVILMPLFFLPVTLEFYEFNKLMLVAAATGLLIVLWAVSVFTSKRLMIAKSPLDANILVLGVAFALSSVFSIHKASSIYGAEGRWFPSLIGYLIFVVFYFVVTSNVKSVSLIKGMLMLFIGSVTASSFVSILSYYGLKLGTADYLKLISFTTTGNSTTAMALASVAAILAYALVLKTKNQTTAIVLAVMTVINLFFALLTGGLMVWVLLVAGALAIFFMVNKEDNRNKLPTLVVNGIILALVAIMFFPATRRVLVKADYPREITLGVKESWIVASSSLRDFPILGSGPSTFYLDFPRYKPLSLNSTNSWNIRFDKPYNEIFNIIATLGLVGTAVAIYMGVRAARLALNTRDLNELSDVLSVGLLATMALFLFTYSTILTTFVFFLMLALTAANIKIKSEETMGDSVYTTIDTSSKSNTIGSIDNGNVAFRVLIALPMFALAAMTGWYIYTLFPSEFYMRRAIQAATVQNASDTYQFQANAINKNTKVDTYQNSYAQTNLALVRGIASKGQLNDQEAETVKNLIAQAIRSARITTEILNPGSVTNWEVRADIYKALIGVAENSETWAAGALERAIQLDPTNPRLRVDLGGIYYAKQDYLTAANYFRQATNLKPDYANAYYNFAQSLVNLKDYQNAIRAMEITQTLVDRNSEDYKKLSTEIEQIKALIPAVAGAQTQKPSVEQIQAQGMDKKEITKQEPLSAPGATTGTAPATSITPTGTEQKVNATQQSGTMTPAPTTTQ